MTEKLAAEQSVAPSRDWNSWDSVYPAEFWHLSSGVKLGVAAYAGSRNMFTRFPPGTGVTLGPRRIDGSHMALTLRHAGTEIELLIDKPADHLLRGRWRALTSNWREVTRCDPPFHLDVSLSFVCKKAYERQNGRT